MPEHLVLETQELSKASPQQHTGVCLLLLQVTTMFSRKHIASLYVYSNLDSVPALHVERFNLDHLNSFTHTCIMVINVCVYLCAHVSCRCACMWVHVSQRLVTDVLLSGSPLSFLRQGHPLNLDLTNLARLAGQPRGSASLCLAGAGLVGMCPCTR